MSETFSKFVGHPDRPVIIGACPRSGTTLLRTMLNSHPDLAMPRETRFVIEAWQRRKEFGDLHRAGNRRRLARWIFKRQKSLARRLGLDPQKAVERLVAAPPTLGSMLATCFVMYAEKHDKPRWGDKRPKYAAQIAAVWDLYPNAHFVNVVRDPRACAASMRKLGWYDGRLAPAVELWQRAIETVDGWRPRLAADQLLEVRFEDLVAAPEEALAGIVTFAGLAADENAVARMLRYHERKEVRSERYHANVARPPDPTRVSGWTDVLETAEIAFVEDATRPLMRRYGYEPVADGVSAPGELLRELRNRRRRQVAARRKLAWNDRIQKLVTHRQPLAARLPAAASHAAGHSPSVD
jgi:hypothetical protein